MPSFAQKLADLARSPRVRTAIEQARQQAAKPQNQRRIEQVRARLARRRPGNSG